MPLPSTRASGLLTFTLDSASQADAVEAALAPDADGDVPGSRATLAREGLTLTLRIEAEDVGALRAAVNAYLRWARVGADIVEIAGIDGAGSPGGP